jgi:hypothetical protein
MARFVTRVEMSNQDRSTQYPLLEEVLSLRGMCLQPVYTVRDVAKLFGVTTRSIQTRISRGQLQARDLPGRAKFLSVDLEDFIRESKTKSRK